ncbi:MAG TPA: helix-hairpin-helix domain-containing protein [Pseudoxanthomonas sp.]|nr:helix-hairpin-helix domain-containing protein [Pseudoxanthomonas sp.]
MKSFAIVLKSLALSLLLATSAFAADKVNINTADAAALDAVLVNVGPAKAQAIVEYRTANGPFKSAEALALVKGIGLKTVENNRDRIELGGGAAAPTAAAKPATAAREPAKPVARR